MPMIAFQPNTRIRSADVNANFANALPLDTPRTVVVTHTWTAQQVFSGGMEVSGPTTFGDGVTVNGALTATNRLVTPRFRANTDGAIDDTSFGWAADWGFYRAGGSVRLAISGENPLMITTGVVRALGGAVFTGDGSGLTNLPASELTGSINPNRLTNVPAGQLTGTVAAGVNVPAGTLTGTINNDRLPNTISQTDITASDLLQGSRLRVNSQGSLITYLRIVEVDWSSTNPVPPNDTVSQTVDVPGAQSGDAVFVSQNNVLDTKAPLIFSAGALAGAVRIIVYNPTSAPISTLTLFVYVLVVRRS